ncbi:hypothetical protein HDV05_006353 [Chytridiales sp. JEL 0842]|nr:hypothetical protein HDV05_006353 [Chytridiales sp. JEL 0842]
MSTRPKRKAAINGAKAQQDASHSSSDSEFGDYEPTSQTTVRKRVRRSKETVASDSLIRSATFSDTPWQTTFDPPLQYKGLGASDTIRPKLFFPTRSSFRTWLQLHSTSNPTGIWLIYGKVKSGIASIRYDEAVEEALCFGWVDGIVNTVLPPMDDKYYIQSFTPRKAKSVWSKINKERIVKLRSHGLMTPAGEASVSIAVENGSWNSLDAVDDLRMDEDIKEAFEGEAVMEVYERLAWSRKKGLLRPIHLAKTSKTRTAKIQKGVETLKGEGGKRK